MNYEPKALKALFARDPPDRETEIEIGSRLKAYREALIQNVVQGYYSGHLLIEKGMEVKTDYDGVGSGFGNNARVQFKKISLF